MLVSSYAKSGAEVVRVIVVTMLRFTNVCTFRSSLFLF